MSSLSSSLIPGVSDTPRDLGIKLAKLMDLLKWLATGSQEEEADWEMIKSLLSTIAASYGHQLPEELKGYQLGKVRSVYALYSILRAFYFNYHLGDPEVANHQVLMQLQQVITVALHRRKIVIGVERDAGGQIVAIMTWGVDRVASLPE